MTYVKDLDGKVAFLAAALVDFVLADEAASLVEVCEAFLEEAFALIEEAIFEIFSSVLAARGAFFAGNLAFLGAAAAFDFSVVVAFLVVALVGCLLALAAADLALKRLAVQYVKSAKILPSSTKMYFQKRACSTPKPRYNTLFIGKFL